MHAIYLAHLIPVKISGGTNILKLLFRLRSPTSCFSSLLCRNILLSTPSSGTLCLCSPQQRQSNSFQHTSMVCENISKRNPSWLMSRAQAYYSNVLRPEFTRHESNLTFLFIWHNSPQFETASSFTRLIDQTQRRTTVGRTLLDEWLARRRDLYLTTHNTHIRHPCPRWDSNTQSQQASGRWERHTNIT